MVWVYFSLHVLPVSRIIWPFTYITVETCSFAAFNTYLKYLMGQKLLSEN